MRKTFIGMAIAVMVISCKKEEEKAAWQKNYGFS
jgi:hypothetical protein